MKDKLNLRVCSQKKVFRGRKGKTIALQTSPKIDSLYALGDKPDHKVIIVRRICMELCNFGKAPGSQLDNFPLKLLPCDLYSLYSPQSFHASAMGLFRNSETMVSSK